MKRPCANLLARTLRLGALLAAMLVVASGHAALYTINQPGGVQGTAVNTTSVIGAGTCGGATAVNFTNGVQSGYSIPSNVIDAGQVNDNITMYLTSGGMLQLVNNNNGNSAGTFGAGATTVSSAVTVGGVQYAVLANTSSVWLSNLANGALTPLVISNLDLTDLTGLDLFIRPGGSGSTRNDLAIGFLYNQGGDPVLKIYYPDGTLAAGLNPSSSYGSVNDVSFDLANNQIWMARKALRQ